MGLVLDNQWYAQHTIYYVLKQKKKKKKTTEN